MTQRFVGDLTWADVAPADHLFDPSVVEALVRPLVPAPAPADFEGRSACVEAITDALVERFGVWALGWRWTANEGDPGGGPVRAWCCPSHSIGTPTETASRVRAALTEWRAWLEHLDHAFAALMAQSNEAPADIRFQRAVASLVNEVVAQTDAADAWYSHCKQVLSWYLERLGVSPERAAELVEAAIGGRFRSWAAPDPASVDAISRELSSRRP